MSSQPDMFDPLHVALRKESQHNLALAAPYLEKAHSLERQAKELCPHDEIIQEVEYYEDEYGKDCPSWTRYFFTCSFCKKSRSISRDLYRRMDPRPTPEEILSNPERHYEK